MNTHKRTNDKIWVDGLGYCVEVVHTDSVGGCYTSYTPIDTKVYNSIKTLTKF